MPNLISTLLLLIVLFYGNMFSFATNPLMNFGLLMIGAHLLGMLAEKCRLSPVAGFTLAGVLAGHGMLGAFNPAFPKFMTIIEALALMFLLSVTLQKYLVKIFDLKIAFSKNILSGALAPLFTGALAFVIFFITGIPWKPAVILSLFAGTYSPLGAEDQIRNDRNIPLIPTVFTAFLAVVFLWGFAVTSAEPELPNRLRMAFLPLISTLTSLCAGFAWVFLIDRFILSRYTTRSPWYAITAFALIYPCFNLFGFDFIMLACGAGFYYGLMSDHDYFSESDTKIPSMIVFALFGAKLQVSDLFLLDRTTWIITWISVLITLLLRPLAPWFMQKLLRNESLPIDSYYRLATHGPLSLLLLYRFLPGFALLAYGDGSFLSIKAITTATVIISLLISITITSFSKIIHSKDKDSPKTPY